MFNHIKQKWEGIEQQQRTPLVLYSAAGTLRLYSARLFTAGPRWIPAGGTTIPPRAYSSCTVIRLCWYTPAISLFHSKHTRLYRDSAPRVYGTSKVPQGTRLTGSLMMRAYQIRERFCNLAKENDDSIPCYKFDSNPVSHEEIYEATQGGSTNKNFFRS